MSKKFLRKDFEKGFELFLQKREEDICDLAVVIASCGVPVGASMAIACEVYAAGWRKGKDGNGKKTV